MKKFLISFMSLMLSLTLSFLLTAFILKLIFWAFSLRFTIKTAFGIWLILGLLKNQIEIKTNKKD